MLPDTVGAPIAWPRFRRSRSSLALPEQEEVAVPGVAHVERRPRRRRAQARGSTCRSRRRAAAARPSRSSARARRPERVRHADRNRAARAGPELHAPPLQVQHRLPLEHVEARLEGVQVLVDMPVGERDQRQRHVRRAERAVDEPAGGQPARAARQRVGELDVLAPDEPVARPPVCELARPVSALTAARRRDRRPPTTQPRPRDPGSPSCWPSPSPSTRSAPRT